MKAIDLHIHTKASVSDSPFIFDIDILKDYVATLSLDAIAITNHNLFDRKQFENITDNLGIKVFPGVEVDLDGGHILVICPIEKIDDFEKECLSLESLITQQTDDINFNQFLTTFPNYKDYLLIPHYKKKPMIKDSILQQLSNVVIVGEVQNANKFTITKKDNNSLIPVLFGDNRMSKDLLGDDDVEKYPIRITYVEIDEISIPNLKVALSDRAKVFVNNTKSDNDFVVFSNGTTASNGLNVIVGKRASGKTYLLNTINKSFQGEENVKYIEQFYISKHSDKTAFQKLIDSSYDNISEQYLSPLKPMIHELIEIDLLEDEKDIDKYLETLKENARRQADSNAFSKTPIYNEVNYSEVDSTELETLIKSIANVIANEKYKTIINKYINSNNIKMLIVELIEKFREEKKDILLKKKTNAILKSVKTELETKASIPKVKEVDLYECAHNKRIVTKFNDLIEKLKYATPLSRLNEDYYGFEINVEKEGYSSATDIKKSSKLSNDYSIREEYDILYDKDPYKFIKELNDKLIPENMLHKLLIKVKTNVTDENGNKVSGGQKAEFILLKQLADASNYDILLIDEPESSFDNLFIKERIIKRLKDISLKTTTFVTTHNNTLGITIKPNKIIYTRNNGDDTYDIFTGTLTSTNLKSMTGEEIPNYNTILDVMEAGEEAYNERKNVYENFTS